MMKNNIIVKLFNEESKFWLIYKFAILASIISNLIFKMPFLELIRHIGINIFNGLVAFLVYNFQIDLFERKAGEYSFTLKFFSFFLMIGGAIFISIGIYSSIYFIFIREANAFIYNTFFFYAALKIGYSFYHPV